MAFASFWKEKNILKLPKYSTMAKCSKANGCQPINIDYFCYKAAAISRKLYVIKSKIIGVDSLGSMFNKK